MLRITQTYFFMVSSLFLRLNSVMGVPLIQEPRLSIVDWTNYYDYEPNGPGTYAFGYDIEDPDTDNVQYRDEERFANGTVVGSYGFLKPDMSIVVVRYIADENGYRAEVEENSRLKYNMEPEPHSRRRPSSLSILESAMQSKEVYKHQNVHESRSRPVDRTRPEQRGTFNTRASVPVEIQGDGSAISSIEPKRFYIVRT